MTLLKSSDQNSREINVALLSLEADIKNKITSFDTSAIDKQLVEINNRIDKINAGGNNTSAQINDIRYEIEDINTKIKNNSAKIEDIEQKLSEIFSAENKVTDFNTTKDSGIYYWLDDTANKPGTDYGVLLVNKYDRRDNNSIWVNQIAYGTNNKIYFRQNINSGSWTEWKAVAFEGEVNATLTVNGKTYNGSEAVDAGVQTVANGGTGVTTQADINKAFIGNLDVGTSDVTDGTEFVSSYASDSGFSSTDEGSLHTPYKRQFVKVWNYIKGKISSVLGLTKDNYGGTAATILDYNKGTPIKVRWGGPGIDSADWYPAFNADGSALEPINRANIHAGTADRARNMYYQNLDLSALDKTKFYPAFCYCGDDFAEVAIRSPNLSDSAEYNQNRIHFDISTMGWSDTPPTLNIREYACYDNSEITIGCIGRGVHQGSWAIWLRGGRTYACFTRNCELSLKTSDYTYGDETYTVGTNYYGGSNTNVEVWFTPQSTITDGAYSSRPITAPNIKASRNITLDSSSGTSLSTYGSEPLSIGFPSGTNDGQSLGIDRNSMQVRINGAASDMYLNFNGGMVNVNYQNQSNGGLRVKYKMVIPIGAPSSPLEDGCIWIER